MIRHVLQAFGRVQGVNYRWRCKQVADQVGIGGWVANLADGTVIIVAEGKKDELKDFEKGITIRESLGPYVERLDLLLSEKIEKKGEAFEIVRSDEEIKKRLEALRVIL